MDNTTSKKIAEFVFDKVLNALSDSEKMIPISYSDATFEKWLVTEVYCRIYNSWKELELRKANWNTFIEFERPNGNGYIDLAVGPFKQTPLTIELDTPVFEFKIWRDDGNDRNGSIKADIQKLKESHFSEAYLVIIYWWTQNKENRIHRFTESIDEIYFKKVEFKDKESLQIPSNIELGGIEPYEVIFKAQLCKVV